MLDVNMEVPDLHISIRDKRMLALAVKKAGDKEIGCMGTIRFDEEKDIHVVENLYFPKQVVSKGEVDWTEQSNGLIEFMDWLATDPEEGGAPNPVGETYGFFSAHSHNTMSVFWSGTDDDFIKKLVKTVPYLYSIVVNSKGEMKCRVDYLSGLNEECPFSSPIHVEDETVKLQTIFGEEAEVVWDQICEFEDNIDEEMDAQKAKFEAAKKKLQDEHNAKMGKLGKEKGEVLGELQTELEALNASSVEGLEEEFDKIWEKQITVEVVSGRENFTHGSSHKTTTTHGAKGKEEKDGETTAGEEKDGKNEIKVEVEVFDMDSKSVDYISYSELNKDHEDRYFMLSKIFPSDIAGFIFDGSELLRIRVGDNDGIVVTVAEYIRRYGKYVTPPVVIDVFDEKTAADFLELAPMAAALMLGPGGDDNDDDDEVNWDDESKWPFKLA